MSILESRELKISALIGFISIFSSVVYIQLVYYYDFLLIPITLILLYLLLFGGAVYSFSKKEGYYSTIVIWGVGCFLYYIALPIELYVTQTDTFSISLLTLQTSSRQLIKIVVAGIIAFLAFTIGYRLSGFNPLGRLSEQQVRQRVIPNSVFFLLMICLIALPLGFYPQFVLSSTYEGNYTISYLDSLYAVVTTFAYFAAVIVGGALLIRSGLMASFLGFLLLGLALGWGLYSSNKDPLLLTLLALGAPYAKRKLYQAQLLPQIFLAVLVTSILFMLFSSFRAGQLNPETLANIRYSLLNFDPAGPFVSLVTVTQRPSPLRFGETYLDSFYLLIPRFLWAERPLDLSVIFAQEMIPRWQPGQGFGYSLLAEAYLNFSWLGVLLQYFLIGLFWGYLWKGIRRIFWYFSNDFWLSFYWVWGFYILLTMHRAPLAGTVKSLVQASVLFFIFSFYLDAARWTNRR
ncbi:MAG: O-antigen polysaccharide polymerase Wzy [Anaerolineae bacterium]|nr:MAG: O-antigen polysaccharide polymerase Wzy [Anaerolineae bacterium]